MHSFRCTQCTPDIVHELSCVFVCDALQGDSKALAENLAGELMPQIITDGALRLVARDPACFDVRSPPVPLPPSLPTSPPRGLLTQLRSASAALSCIKRQLGALGTSLSHLSMGGYVRDGVALMLCCAAALQGRMLCSHPCTRKNWGAQR